MEELSFKNDIFVKWQIRSLLNVADWLVLNGTNLFYNKRRGTWFLAEKSFINSEGVGFENYGCLLLGKIIIAKYGNSAIGRRINGRGNALNLSTDQIFELLNESQKMDILFHLNEF